MRVYLDTNVLVSAYVARGICADLIRFILAEHQLVTGKVNLEELRRVLGTRFHAPPELLDSIEPALRAEEVIPTPREPSELAVRDPDDRWTLTSAIEAEVDLLVTGDQDLLSIAAESPIPIVDPRGCWERLRGASG